MESDAVTVARAALEVTVNGIAPAVVDWPADMPEADRAPYLQRVTPARVLVQIP